MKFVSTIVLVFLISSCAISPINNVSQRPNNELLEFAKANCFFWYFKKKDYDLHDIRAISGGVVEVGSYSAEKYQQVSLLVKEYKPKILTKQNIDIDLLKCFRLEKDKEFIQSINRIGQE